MGCWRPRRFAHANLYVSDLDRSMDFYKTVVGLEEVYRRPAVKAGFLSNGNTHHDIGMVEITSPLCKTGKAGLNHLAFETDTEADLVDGYRRAVERGHRFPRTVDHDITRSIYGADPDGNAIEMYADTTKNWRTQRAGIVTKPTPAWTPGTPEPSRERLYHEAPEIRRVEEAVFHPRRISQAVLVARNFDDLLAYYTDVVGLAPKERAADIAVLSGAVGGRDVVLLRASEGRTPGLHHLRFDVDSAADLARSAARARAAGLALERDAPDAEGVVLRDPDGIRLQFRALDAKGLGEAAVRPYLM
ncbi:MAG: dioxygenase [Alphaproteobacteria bacterium]|nr:dioxygenase [Alphaproteobacteria bacterium]